MCDADTFGAVPTVTNITPQRRPERVNIHIDGEFWSGAPVALLVEAGLKVGRVLSEGELDALAEQILVREAIESCLRRLALRGRTRRELSQGLRERKFEDHIAEQALAHLDAIGMLDDYPVARLRAESLQARGAGTRKISMELGRLGIDPDVREQVIAEVVTHAAQIEAAGRVVQRRFGAPPYARPDHARAERWLRAQGHGQEIISELVGRPAPAEESGDPDEDASAARPAREVDAVALLRRKYPRAHTDSTQHRRAVAFLQRRGVGYEEIRQAVEALADDEAA